MAKKTALLTDPVLEAYRTLLGSDCTPKEKADFLIGLIQYLRRRYRSTSEFKEEIIRYTAQLEAQAARIQTKELIPVSRAISFSRKFVCGMGQAFGEDLHRAPKGNDLRAIRRLKSPKVSDLVDPCFEFDLDDVEEENAKLSESE